MNSACMATQNRQSPRQPVVKSLGKYLVQEDTNGYPRVRLPSLLMGSDFPVDKGTTLEYRLINEDDGYQYLEVHPGGDEK